VSDISDRKRAEATLRQSEEQLQGLTTAALSMNSALSVDQVLKVITDQAAAIIGTHQAVASMTLNQNWAQAITAIYLSDKYAAWHNYEEKPTGAGIYNRVCALNRPLRLTQAELEAHPSWQGFSQSAAHHPPLRGWLAAPLVGREGQNIGLIQLSDKYSGEFTDADEAILVQLAQMASVAVENARLYEAEQQAREAAERAKEAAQSANQIKDEFLAVLSHELRSPLNPILGWSRLLQTNTLTEAKVQQALATIERNAKLQAELIEDLLDVSRILRGKLSLHRVPVDLVSTIQSAIETVRLTAEAKAIDLQFTVHRNGDLPLQIQGDSARLQQVVWNLLSNAIKFTPEQGRVEVQLERLESDQAQITVTDTGKGITPDFLDYVFDYFRQADSATTRKFGGLGLGLAIVQHLVKLHGGQVQAASPGEGQGATFTVVLPLLNPQSATAPASGSDLAPSPADRPPLTGLHLLVVDDSADAREYAVCLLEQSGAQVSVAASAQEALALLSQTAIDVLLSDIGMPDMDGCTLLRQVRALPPDQGGSIPAIALTAYADENSQQQVRAAGFQHHIFKPLEPAALIRAVRGLGTNGAKPASPDPN
jgi:signal transduction histidine kinase/ActR/RegA family two-component response regulator